MKRIVPLAIVLFVFTSNLAWAGASWPELREMLYENQPILPAGRVVALQAPYRAQNDLRTVVGAEINAPPGGKITAVTLVIDENPMPVSAVFRFAEPLPRFSFNGTFRINGPTPVHVIAETEDGRLFAADSFVKTSGVGACAAPPGTDVKEALANLGKMTIRFGGGAGAQTVKSLLSGTVAADITRQMSLGVSHPSHSGLQMDQISMLFIPARYVEKVKIDVNGGAFVDITGSISLSENPELTLSVPKATRNVGVTLTDSEGTTSRAWRGLAGY